MTDTAPVVAVQVPEQPPQSLGQQRLAICDACEYLRRGPAGVKWCGKCGCVLQVKTKIPGATCPIHKW